MKLLFVTILGLVSNHSWASLAEIEVIFTGTIEPGGIIRISFENSRSQYESRDGSILPFRTANIFAHNPQTRYSIRFRQVPFGKYTIKAFYDGNNSNSFDTNFVGYPQEMYGFSNNARGLFGPPDFEEAVFEIKQPKVTHTIHLK